MKLVPTLALVSSTAVLAVATVPAQTRVSVSSAGTPSNGETQFVKIAHDGTAVAFMSVADNLVPGDTNGHADIFVRDLLTGMTERVSVSSTGLQANGPSTAPAISPNGQTVVFSSMASNLVPGDTNGRSDVFSYHRPTGTLRLLSVGRSGGSADGGSFNPSIGLGDDTVFESDATNLIAGDTNGRRDIFLWVPQSGTVSRLVDLGVDGQQPDGDSATPRITTNSRYVTFRSAATNLVANDNNGLVDVFLRSVVPNSETERVSVSATGGEANDRSGLATASGDGRFVVFESRASNLTIEDSNPAWDVFLRDTEAETTTLVSRSTTGVSSSGIDARPEMTDDGEWITFWGGSTNLVANDTNGVPDVFLYRRETGALTRESVAANGAQGNAESREATITGDGRQIAFASSASNLVPNDLGGFSDGFVTDSSYRHFWVDGLRGSDRPDWGVSSAQPWKTVTYALQQMPARVAPRFFTLHVAGGQTYSPATNGETFPIQAIADVSIVGEGGRPVFDLPAGAVGFEFDRNTNYERQNVCFSGLELRNGLRGIELGAEHGATHSPAFVDCIFADFVDAGIFMETVPSVGSGLARHAALVDRCQFVGGSHGVEIVLQHDNGAPSSSDGYEVDLLFRSCRFSDQTVGIQVGQRRLLIDVFRFAARFDLESCAFRDCGRGFALDAGVGQFSAGFSPSVTANLRGSRFIDSPISFGVNIGAASVGNLTVSDCTLVGGGAFGASRLSVSSLGAVGGNYEFRQNHISGSGYGLRHFTVAADRIVIESNELRECGNSAIDLHSGAALNTVSTVEFVANRVYDSLDAGLLIRGNFAVDARSSMFVNGMDGMRLERSNEAVSSAICRGLTFVGNADQGFEFYSPRNPPELSSCIFAGNRSELGGTGPVTVTYSCLQIASPNFGPTNLYATDPLLIPATLKLDPMSPCIDAGDPAMAAGLDYEGDPRPAGAWDMGADEFVPAGSIHAYGVGCAGDDGTQPTISSPQTAARLGGSLAVELDGAVDHDGRPALAAALIIGRQDRPVVSLDGLGAAGCWLWNEALLFTSGRRVDGVGHASWSAPLGYAIPIGESWMFQWAVLDRDANPLGLLTTRGLRVTIGS